MTVALASIHESIDRLRRLRSLVRIGSAVCMVLGALLAGLMLIFLTDLVTHAGRVERALMLVLLLGGVGWVAYRFLLPAVRTREDSSTLALLIERRQGIDTDLVAAVQFADPNRPQFGSVALREAVVAYVDEVLPGLDLLEGFDARPLRPYAAGATALVLLWLIVILAVPAHASAFGSRLLLSNQLYPTRTRIAEVIAPAAVLRAGSEVRFIIRLEGTLPEQAIAEVRASAGGKSTIVHLKPDAGDPARYAGSLRIAHDTLVYRIRAGDAYTLPVRVLVVPEPKLILEATITPPSYAGDVAAEQITRSIRVTALEGSSIDLLLQTDQPLKQVAVEIDGQELLMTPGPEGYRLTSPGPPLSPLSSNLTLRTRAIDEFGIALEQTPTMTIAMQPDRKPRIEATAITRHVLPTGRPTLSIEASDDLGLGRIVLHRVVVPAGGETIQFSTDLTDLLGSQRTFTDRVTLSMADMALSPGDRLELTVEAFDHRGALPGESAVSAPIVIEVIDRQTLLQNLLDSDRALDQKLDSVIDTQLDIGGKSP